MQHTESVRVEGSGQTVDYIEHVTLNNGGRKGRHTLRVRIHNDSHKEQSFALVERWDGAKWREVVSRRGDALQMEHGVGYRRDRYQPAVFQALFIPDRNVLIQLAEEVL